MRPGPSSLSSAAVGVRVSVMRGGVVLATDVPARGVQVEWTADRVVPTQVTFEAPLDWVPTDPLSPLANFGQRVHVVSLLEVDGLTHEVELGWFQISEWSEGSESVSVTALDLMQLLEDDPMVWPSSPPPGASLRSELQRLAGDHLPVVLDDVADVPVASTVQWDTSRTTSIRDLCESHGLAFGVRADGCLHVWERDGGYTEVVHVEETRADVRVGTWNLYYSGAPDHPWSGRRGLLASTVITAGLTALAVQESDFPGQPADQSVQLQESLNAASGSSKQWRAVTMGSRNGVAFDGAVWTWTGVGGCEPSLWAERNLVWLLLRHTTGVMMVMASDHWHPDSGSIRVAQAHATRARLGEIAAEHGCATVLGVDMNDWQPDWYGQPPAIMTEDGTFSRLKTLPGATGTTMPTWHDWKASPPWSEAGQSLGEWLDEIFVTRGTVRSGGIWDTTIPLTSALASDHHLLTATVGLSSRQATTSTVWRGTARREPVAVYEARDLLVDAPRSSVPRRANQFTAVGSVGSGDDAVQVTASTEATAFPFEPGAYGRVRSRVEVSGATTQDAVQRVAQSQMQAAQIVSQTRPLEIVMDPRIEGGDVIGVITDTGEHLVGRVVAFSMTLDDPSRTMRVDVEVLQW